MTKGRKKTQLVRAPRGWAWYISRAKAIARGDLKDVTDDARQAGISCPVALTPLTWHECVSAEDRNALETERLRHLLNSLRDALSPLGCELGHVDFPVTVVRLQAGTSQVVRLDALAGTDDDGKPVITVKLPAECYFWEENLPLAKAALKNNLTLSPNTPVFSRLFGLSGTVMAVHRVKLFLSAP